MTQAVVAVDGGGSTTRAVLLDLDGGELGRAEAASASPHIVGLARAVAAVDDAVRASGATATGIEVVHAGVYVSGLAYPVEIDAFRSEIYTQPWARSSLVVENDLFALLRAGTSESDAVAVVCGTGINAVGVRGDGATVRFPAVGMISGDWGGGWHLGEQALWHAARAVDGRGAPTRLADALPAVYGVDDIPALIEALHFERIATADLSLASPAVFAMADAGDTIAVRLIERQAEEIVALAIACLRRLDLLGRAVPVVLGGGVVAARHPLLLERIGSGLRASAPLAELTLVTEPPVSGAIALALAHVRREAPLVS